MAIVYSTTLKNTRLDAVDTAVGASGVLEIYTSGLASLLVSISLNNPAFAAASGGTMSLDATGLSGTAGNAGTAAEAKITDGTSDVITGLTVGQGTGDISLDNTTIASGQTVNITSGTITHG